jgi:uncharacterized phage protein gp47/JayE
MPGPYPLATLGPTIGPGGITAPSFADILASLQASFQLIYGSDAYLGNDSQDGQLLALFAQAINDCNNQAIATFQSFSPVYAQGAGLSSNVKINGIQRLVATNSTAVGNVIGTVGTVITNGLISDGTNQWALPSSVTIPSSGLISVTVTCQTAGAIAAQTGAINQIATPTLGWASFTNTSPAVPGNAVETDAALRQRQSVSTGNPALTPLGALLGALLNLSGVTQCRVYENTTGSPDPNGLPAHSISVVIQGGSLAQIALTIGQRKTPGAATYGSTSQQYSDPNTGILYTINFYVLALTNCKVQITGSAKSGWNTGIATEIQQAVAAYIDGLGIGQPVQWSRVFQSAYLNGAADGSTYEITNLQIGLLSGSLGVVDIPIAFNAAAFINNSTTDVVVTIS